MAEPESRTRRRWRRLGGTRVLPSGRVQVRVRGLTAAGIPFALEATVLATLAEATLARFRERAELYRAGLEVPEQRVSLREWKASYLQKRSVSSETKRWTREQESTWKTLRALHGLPLQGLTADAVNRWAVSCLHTGPGRAVPGSGKGSRAYVRHAFELLNRLVRAALDAQVIARCPWGSSRPSEIPSHGSAHVKRAPIDPADLRKILDAARSSQDASLYLRVWLAVQSGARPHELARAQVAWLVPVESIPRAVQVPGAAMLRLPAAKKGHAHDVPVPADLHDALRAYVLTLSSAARAKGLLFPVLHRSRWQARQSFIPSGTWKALCARVGVTGVVAYQTRHTRLTDLAEGFGDRAAQAVAGHRSSNTTQTYLGKPSVHRHGAAAFAPTETLAAALALRSPSAGGPTDPSPPTKPTRRKPTRTASVHVAGSRVNGGGRNGAKARLDFSAPDERAPGHATKPQGSVPSEGRALAVPGEGASQNVTQLSLAAVVVRGLPESQLHAARSIVAKLRAEAGQAVGASSARGVLATVPVGDVPGHGVPGEPKTPKRSVIAEGSGRIARCFTRNDARGADSLQHDVTIGENACKITK